MALEPSQSLQALLVGANLAETCAAALAALGSSYAIVSDLREAETRLKDEPFAILVAEESLLPAILAAADRPYPRHFLGGSPIDLADLEITLRKLKSGEIFGMERYDVPVKEKAELSGGESRYPIVDRMKDYFREQGIAPRILDKVELVLHELLMNAARLNVEAKKDGPPLALAYGLGPDTLAVSVRDPFGALDGPSLFAAIRRAALEKSVVDEPGRGAGLGLFLSLKASGNLVINVSPGRATEVIAFFHRVQSQGEAARMGNSLHYFQELKS